MPEPWALTYPTDVGSVRASSRAVVMARAISLPSRDRPVMWYAFECAAYPVMVP